LAGLTRCKFYKEGGEGRGQFSCRCIAPVAGRGSARGTTPAARSVAVQEEAQRSKGICPGSTCGLLRDWGSSQGGCRGVSATPGAMPSTGSGSVQAAGCVCVRRLHICESLAVSMESRWDTRREGGGDRVLFTGRTSTFSSSGGGAPFFAASRWSCQSAESKYL